MYVAFVVPTSCTHCLILTSTEPCSRLFVFVRTSLDIRSAHVFAFSSGRLTSLVGQHGVIIATLDLRLWSLQAAYARYAAWLLRKHCVSIIFDRKVKFAMCVRFVLFSIGRDGGKNRRGEAGCELCPGSVEPSLQEQLPCINEEPNGNDVASFTRLRYLSMQ